VRGFERIRLPGESDGRNFDLRFQLANGPGSGEAKMLGGILVIHRLSRRFPNDLERHARGSGDGIERGPAWLIDHRDSAHFQRDGFSIGADVQSIWRYGNHPIETSGRNWRMEVVNLIGGNRRSPKKGESNMGEDAGLRGPRRPILASHDAVIGGGRAEGNSISLIVGAHAGKCAAPRHPSFEVIDVRGLKV
jgi:hypothetical protein